MIQNLLHSREWRLNNLYSIIAKNKKAVKFVPNPVQQEILDYKKECKKAGKAYRFIALKARQGGVTTEEIIYGLDKSLFYKHQDITLTAHTVDKAREIFRIAKFAYNSLPAEIRKSDGTIWTKPKAHNDNRNELVFDGTGSSFRVVRDTRSGTPSHIHITELAFMD